MESGVEFAGGHLVDLLDLGTHVRVACELLDVVLVRGARERVVVRMSFDTPFRSVMCLGMRIERGPKKGNGEEKERLVGASGGW
jgi:hypothetical protein